MMKRLKRRKAPERSEKSQKKGKLSTASFRKKLEQQKGRKIQVEKDIKRLGTRLEDLKKEIGYSERAQAVIQAVARQTQQELEYRIEEPVSLAQAAVYDNPYKQLAEFKNTGRGTTECYLKFERDGNIINPFDGSGGGPVDISTYALRLGSLTLSRPRLRPVLLLDEPFRFVSKARMPYAGQMLKETADELGIQILMVTHIDELIKSADEIFNVAIKNGESYIE